MIIMSLVLALASNALAGGTANFGKVTAFNGENGNYEFRFSETGEQALRGSCREYDVVVVYSRVPWYSWLPFLKSGSHPTKAMTIKSAEALRAAFKSKHEIMFGSMGYGLVPTNKPCSFKSRGLGTYTEQEKTMILSFHDAV